jgi:hypothetical protein
MPIRYLRTTSVLTSCPYDLTPLYRAHPAISTNCIFLSTQRDHLLQLLQRPACHLQYLLQITLKRHSCRATREAHYTTYRRVSLTLRCLTTLAVCTTPRRRLDYLVPKHSCHDYTLCSYTHHEASDTQTLRWKSTALRYATKRGAAPRADPITWVIVTYAAHLP